MIDFMLCDEDEYYVQEGITCIIFHVYVRDVWVTLVGRTRKD